jgi:hypothetical protein
MWNNIGPIDNVERDQPYPRSKNPRNTPWLKMTMPHVMRATKSQAMTIYQPNTEPSCLDGPCRVSGQTCPPLIYDGLSRATELARTIADLLCLVYRCEVDGVLRFRPFARVTGREAEDMSVTAAAEAFAQTCQRL